MKVFKNKKQRIVALFLSLVFAFMLVPFTDAYALSSMGHIQSVNLDYEYVNDTDFTCSDNAFLVAVCDNSDSSLRDGFYNISVVVVHQVTSSDAESGVSITFNGEKHSYSATPRDVGKYYVFLTSTGYIAKINDVIGMSIYKGTEADFRDKLTDGSFLEDSNFKDPTVEGSIDKPIYDEDIGTLIISKSKMYEESNGEDVNDLYNLFSWKMKTNTGFSLSDNKYARTFIQVRVESKCVVYDDRRHTKLHKKFDNYGEKAMLINSHPADSQPLKISYLTDIPNVLPKTHAETHNPVYTGYNYTLYFRVVCTDDLAVIPSDTSEWHCGGWRALDCNADILVGQSDTTENGGFDDSDNWVADEDDGNNSIESGSDSVHDSDDAKDDFNNSSPAVDSSVNGAISTLQSLLDMIRHVPEIISILFSFLPPWCLSLVALGFVALVVLIIYKLVRG